ncbi:hypothetical protein SSYM_0628 [Serratia symbiotica str. Tucson]|uniref:Uncharacterized protein n=1 Tax=Serratia symbiotica str. Tucson TaxID=914128 RepID=E9CKG7_9GAMM|nr:hypothetical protein SSYM_0628 [Serratia symbiotica str. Tucson]
MGSKPPSLNFNLGGFLRRRNLYRHPLLQLLARDLDAALFQLIRQVEQGCGALETSQPFLCPIQQCFQCQWPLAVDHRHRALTKLHIIHRYYKHLQNLWVCCQYALNIFRLYAFPTTEKQVVQPTENSQLPLHHHAAILGMEPALVIGQRLQTTLPPIAQRQALRTNPYLLIHQFNFATV